MCKQAKIVWGRWVALLVVLCVGYALFRAASGVVAASWILAETSSDTHFGTAALLVDAGSLAGNTTYFFVRDPAKSKAKPLCVGGPYISDGPIKLQEAVWSKDGSVIAVRVKVGETAGKGFTRYDETFWIDAYDFRIHRVVKVGPGIKDRSAAIKALLMERGGAGPKNLSSPSIVGRSLTPTEWRQFAPVDENYTPLYTSDAGIKN